MIFERDDVVIFLASDHLTIFCESEKKIKDLMVILDDYRTEVYERLITGEYRISKSPKDLYKLLVEISALGRCIIC